MMVEYKTPSIQEPVPVPDDHIILIPSGDLRNPHNRNTWHAQEEMESRLRQALLNEGYSLQRAFPYNPDLQHGYIWNQRMGMAVFQEIHPGAKLIVAIAAWQYSHHVLAGLRDHRGPILTVANWSGKWPGLVGLLNLNACLVKIGKSFSTIWSRDFTDDFFKRGLRQWLLEGKIDHDTSHVRDLVPGDIPAAEAALGVQLARQLRQEKAILGVFDEGCMGMTNAIIEDELLNPTGIYKERLSQSALLVGMQQVSAQEAHAVRQWLEERGLRFDIGPDPTKDLTNEQVHLQCKMYIAAVRMAAEYGCAAIGIQYQQGLKDIAPASDLVEGLLNNPDRPPVFHPITGEELYRGQAIPHFNEADEGAALDLLVNNRVWSAMGLDPSSTLHDLRWGEHFRGDGIDNFVWVFMISGAVPASHLIDGYAGATSMRQSTSGFPSGGGTLRGISKPGQIVWSRVYIDNSSLHADLGRGHVVRLPIEETRRRWEACTSVWPIMHAVLHGVTRNQMMARHRSNHIEVAYAPDAERADKALEIKSAMLDHMGIQVHWCGI